MQKWRTIKVIEDYGKKQLEEIKKINIGSKSLKAISFFNKLGKKAEKLMGDIILMEDWLDSA